GHHAGGSLGLVGLGMASTQQHARGGDSRHTARTMAHDDADTARRLKNAASRAWHARRRLSRRAGEARYADGQARAGDDARYIIGDEREFDRASDGVHARTCLGARGLSELLDACGGMEDEALVLGRLGSTNL
ncbi:Unknown protein, partial [Striga hermonthica]